MDKIFKIIVMLGVITICFFIGYYIFVEIPKNRQNDATVLVELNKINKELRDINPDYDGSAFDKNPFW